jgi:hypothetical protein
VTITTLFLVACGAPTRQQPDAGGGGGDGGMNAKTIVITPADIEIVAVVGAITPTNFTATIDGVDVTSQVTWNYSNAEIGSAAPGGQFTPTGARGGVGQLNATMGNSFGSTSVSVVVRKVVDTTGSLDPAQQGAFDTPSGGADPTLSVVYPLDGVVMPVDALPPVVQWNGGGAGDVYRLRLAERYFEYTVYLTGAPPDRYTIPVADWESIAASGTGPESDPVQMTLTRRSGATIYQGKTQSIKIARASVPGVLYYWELPDACGGGNSNGRVLRIKPQSETPEEFFQPGGCWGCHTVSRDGKKMAAEFNDGNGPLYTLQLDAMPMTTYAEINPSMPGGNYIFSAFNPDGTKLLVSDNTAFNPAAAPLHIISALNGQILTPNAMTGCGEPAWSPDGTLLAAVCNMTGGSWTFDATGGNLVTMDVAADQVTVSNQLVVVPQAGGPGRPAWPSFSPDSAWIAYGRPTYGSRSIGDGTIWMVRSNGMDNKQLLNMSGDNKSFNPVFSPTRSGGYYWIAFITRRDYGNTIVGANRQQLWIAAVDEDGVAADPSHPPFYVRGQETCGKSENAYYAVDPFIGVGGDCTHGSQCETGHCLSGVCGMPLPNTAVRAGNTCGGPSVCASGTSCVDGYCAEPVIR